MNCSPEIKAAQVAGLSDYPVFTRKVATDVSYLACAKKLLMAEDAIYPAFATHNANTIGQVKAPFERHRMVAASLLIWCMAGQM